jgi:hypothetical protein
MSLQEQLKQMEPGEVYVVTTVERQKDFRFECISVGSHGAMGYMAESASWPRSIAFRDVRSIAPATL